jgi:hypothetical protein
MVGGRQGGGWWVGDKAVDGGWETRRWMVGGREGGGWWVGDKAVDGGWESSWAVQVACRVHTWLGGPPSIAQRCSAAVAHGPSNQTLTVARGGLRRAGCRLRPLRVRTPIRHAWCACVCRRRWSPQNCGLHRETLVWTHPPAQSAAWRGGVAMRRRAPLCCHSSATLCLCQLKTDTTEHDRFPAAHTLRPLLLRRAHGSP